MSALKDFFLASAESKAKCTPQISRSLELPNSISLLCQPELALTAGSTLAAELGRHLGAPTALALFWRGGGMVEPLGGSLAFPQTRRLAERLSSSSANPVAAGRLVRAVLPEEPSDVEIVIEQLAEQWQIPIVSVLCGARDMTIDRVINRHDVVYLVRKQRTLGSSALERYVRASLDALLPPVVEWEFESGPIVRLLARAGLNSWVISRRQLATPTRVREIAAEPR